MFIFWMYFNTSICISQGEEYRVWGPILIFSVTLSLKIRILTKSSRVCVTGLCPAPPPGKWVCPYLGRAGPLFVRDLTHPDPALAAYYKFGLLKYHVGKVPTMLLCCSFTFASFTSRNPSSLSVNHLNSKTNSISTTLLIATPSSCLYQKHSEFTQKDTGLRL